MIIREANFSDVKRISEIVCFCYRNFEFTDDYSKALVEELIEKRGTNESIKYLIETESTFVISHNAEIVGMISLNQNEITKLYVQPNLQKQGIGTLLFRYAESFIKKNGFAELFLGAAASTAIPFYEKMGMQKAEIKKINCGPCKGKQTTILKKEIRTIIFQNNIRSVKTK